jgi:replicative DNA helicase
MIDAGFIFTLLENPDNVQQAVQAGFERADFNDGYSRAYDLIVDHYKRADGALPSREAVEQGTGLEIIDSGYDFGFLFSEMKKRRLFREVQALMGVAGNHLRANDPVAALEAIKELVKTEITSTGQVKPSKPHDLRDQVMANLNRVRSGFAGVALPWESITNLTMGMWQQTATYIVARPGVGKTQVAVLTAHKAIKEGRKVLFISPEMSKAELAERFYVLESQVSATNMMTGNLSSFEEAKLKAAMDNPTALEGVFMIDNEDDLSPGGMEAAIRQIKPDLVIVDSIYMLHFKGIKSERTEKAVDWIRQSSKVYNVPFLGIHQMNRMATKDAKHGGGFDTSSIALSDQLLWDAHAVFMLEQDADMKADRRLRIHVGKLRRGAHPGRPIDVRFDLERMDFSEIAVTEQAFEDTEATSGSAAWARYNVNPFGDAE